MPSKAMKTMKVNPKSKARPKAKAAALGAAADIENFIAGSAKKSDDENEESEYSESEEESESGTEEPPVKKRPGANVAMKKPGAAPGNTTDRLKKHQWGKMVRDGAISSEVDNIVGGCSPFTAERRHQQQHRPPPRREVHVAVEEPSLGTSHRPLEGEKERMGDNWRLQTGCANEMRRARGIARCNQREQRESSRGRRHGDLPL